MRERNIERGNFSSLPLHSTHFSILCVRSVLLGPRSGLRVVNLPPLGRIPLINEEHCARPKFCERHTRASTTGDGRKTRDRAVGGEKKRRDRKRREDGSRGGNPSTCLSSLLLSIFVFSSLLRGSRSIWEQTNFYHHGTRIPCNIKFAPQSIDIT